MSMDDRQRQIKEGAGLDEARLNQDFIEFLKKWSSPVLLVLAILAVGYWGWNRLQTTRELNQDAAWQALADARSTARPAQLVAVADEFSSIRPLALEARMLAGRLWLNAAMFRKEPGGADATAVIDDAKRAEFLTSAAGQFQEVVRLTEADPNLELHTMAALFGLAAVRETEGKFDEPGALYDRIVTLSARHFPELGAEAKSRKETLASLKETRGLVAEAEVKSKLPPAIPALPPMNPPGVPVAPLSGTPTLDLQPMTAPTVVPPAGITPVPSPMSPAPAPTPSPAPASPAPAPTPAPAAPAPAPAPAPR